ncbi:DNA-formamidopyrimidine glycosylase [Microseira sp. BLCC-F43]|uniref:DNA-formamidopyrimidine glycosylase n=1 Tax=Microseira sp. BLCC-F43 TaxID=3153602 RepID=UPI0035B951DB
MPELPEVETVKRGLNQVTLNQQIQGGDVLLSRTIAHPFSAVEFLVGVKDTAIVQWHRRGKYLLAELAVKEEQTGGRSDAGTRGEEEDGSMQNSAGWLGVHLRMTGQLLWLHRDAPLQKHTRVRLFFGSDWELRFVDQRTFGQMWWVPPTEAPEKAIAGLKKLGPDPFSDGFTVDYLVEKWRSRRRPIKNALLDQELVAGIGNIYADEALFLAGVRPTTLCTELNREQIERIRNVIIEVLQASIEAGGTTFSNFINVQGMNGNYGGVAWVYNRDRQPCRVCGSTIEKLKLAGRSAHFCPQCQC